MAVTIYDIAKEANVGIGTVSRVFNNHPSVTDETRERILTVAKRLNYHPYAYAQALARKRSNTISVVIPFFTNNFFTEVLQGVQDKISVLGYDLIVYGINHREQVQEYLQRSVQRGRVDGILFFSMRLPEGFKERFRERHIPLILVDTFHEAFDSISVENFQGAVVATTHLIELGHTRIGMINANLVSVPAQQRVAGFKEALAHNGLLLNPEFVVTSETTKHDGFSREAGYLSMKELLKSKEKFPTAFFISSDVQAIGAISALREKGLRVPDDVALVSFDDIELAQYFDLTTMRQPMYEMGELAVEKLMQRIEHPNAPSTHISFEPTLVIRGSSGARKKEPVESSPVL